MSIQERILCVALAVAIIAGLFFIVDYFINITPLTDSYVEWASQFYQEYKPFSYAVWVVPILVSILTMDAVDEDDQGCLLILASFGITFGYIIFLPLIISVVILVILFYAPFAFLLDKISRETFRERSILIDICILAGLASALALIPASREEIHWQWAFYKDEFVSYEAYLSSWPEGHHADEALSNIEPLHWKDAEATNTIRSYQKYSTTHPEGPNFAEAQTRIAALLVDETPFRAAIEAGTDASLKKFLEDFPGHQKEGDIQQAIKDMAKDMAADKDIFDLLSDGKITIAVHGSGIKSVDVRIRKLVPYPITVRVPIGSYFVSTRQSAQNMVTTAERKVRLTDDWSQVSVPAVCANRTRDIPSSHDSFIVRRLSRFSRISHEAELARLIPVLDKAVVPFAVRQAAVWIVTDNADYDDLGILVGTWVIEEYESARAMQICDEAGIDITKKAIWRDRQKILSGLQDEDLREWLKSKM